MMTNEVWEDEYTIDFGRVNDAYLDASRTASDEEKAHWARVAENVKLFTDDPEVHVAALFHDLIEDGYMTSHDVVWVTNERVLDLVLALTRKKTETYAEFIDRLATDLIDAKYIKMADLMDNMTRSGEGISDEKKASLLKRYKKAMATLVRSLEQ